MGPILAHILEVSVTNRKYWAEIGFGYLISCLICDSFNSTPFWKALRNYSRYGHAPHDIKNKNLT